MQPLANSRTLQNLFAGLTEQTFISELGLTDVPLVDYISELLTRFVHADAVYAVRGASGRRLEELAEMLVEAERNDNRGDPRREIFRHVGDFALFWTGVYPEALKRKGVGCTKDSLIDYTAQGKRSYYLASTYADTPTQAQEAPVLRRLSEEFELCAHGLQRVRVQWEHAAHA